MSTIGKNTYKIIEHREMEVTYEVEAESEEEARRMWQEREGLYLRGAEEIECRDVVGDVVWFYNYETGKHRSFKGLDNWMKKGMKRA